MPIGRPLPQGMRVASRMRVKHRNRPERTGWAMALAVATIVGVGTASAQGELAAAVAENADESRGVAVENTCVACHSRKETVRELPTWERDHFILWSRGAHGLSDVTCDECHGGNPGAPDKPTSHAGVRRSNDPESPVHFKNLPRTCGTCHGEVYEAFVDSRHYKELRRERLAPSCNTCHGFLMEVAEPSHALAESCQLCHNTEPEGVKAEIAGEARNALDHIARARSSIDQARLTIELARELGLTPKQPAKQLREAERRLDATGVRWHRFDLDAFDRDLGEIQALAESAKDGAMQAILSR